MYTVLIFSYQLATTRKRSFKLDSCSELYDEKNIFLVDWVGGRSGIALLSPFSQHSYSIVLDEKSNNLLPFFFRRTALNYYCATVTEMGICYTAVQEKIEFVFALNFIVFEFNVPRTISSINSARY